MNTRGGPSSPLTFQALYPQRRRNPNAYRQRTGQPCELLEQALVAIEEDDVDLFMTVWTALANAPLLRDELALVVLNTATVESIPPQGVLAALMSQPNARSVVDEFISRDVAFARRWARNPEIAPLIRQSMYGLLTPVETLLAELELATSRSLNLLVRDTLAESNPAILRSLAPGGRQLQPLERHQIEVAYQQALDEAFAGRGLSPTIFEQHRSLGGYQATVEPSTAYDLASIYRRRLYSPDWYRAWLAAVTDVNRYEELGDLWSNADLSSDLRRHAELEFDFDRDYTFFDIFRFSGQCLLLNPERLVDSLLSVRNLGPLRILEFLDEDPDGEAEAHLDSTVRQRLLTRLQQWADERNDPLARELLAQVAANTT